MTVITSAPTASPRSWWTSGRRTLAAAANRGAKTVSAARARYRRPALTVAGLGTIAAAGYQVNLGVGLLITGLMCLLFEWIGGDDE